MLKFNESDGMRINNILREKIVLKLTEDSRQSLRMIAKGLSVSTTTVSKAVRMLERNGSIQKYTAQVDWHKLGYESMMCLQIALDSNADVEKVGKDLRGYSQVKHIFYTTGESNFSVYVVCRNNAEAIITLERLRHIHGVERIVPHVVLKTF